MKSFAIAVLGVCGWLMFLFVGVARAEKPVVIVTGDDAAVVDAVEKAIRGKVQVVGVGERARAAAVVEVTVTPTGKAARKAKKLTATVVVTQGADEREVGRMVVKEKRKKLPKAVGKVVWKKLGRQIMGAKGRVRADEPVAVEVEEASVVEEEAAAQKQPSRSTSTTTTTTTTATTTQTGAEAPVMLSDARASASAESKDGRFIVSVSERPFYRRLRWNDDLDQVLRRYDLAANAVGVSVGVRPVGGVKGLWVGVDGELVVGVKGSRTTDGTEYGTSGSEVVAGVGYGVRVAGADLAVSAAYGEQRFSIDDEMMIEELVPDVTYRYARGGLDARVPMGGRWTLLARGGWRQLIDVGEMKEWFPRQSGNGIDASVGAGVRITKWLGAYARADVRHYFFAMNPEPGDEWIAGGAVDLFLGGAIGLAVSIR